MLTIANSILIIIAYTLGVIVGQKLKVGEKVEMPSPVKVVNKIREDIKESKEIKEFEINLENIENYNGTSLGQKPQNVR